MSSKIRTYSGLMFDPLNPRMEDIRIQDIAWALSNQCRFSGHTNRHYSIAEHSVVVSKLVSANNALAGLLHDASEAYLVDVPRPVKHSGIMDGYLGAEKVLQMLIFEKYRVDWNTAMLDVKDADDRALKDEQQVLMRPWDERPASFHWESAEKFLKRFTEII